MKYEIILSKSFKKDAKKLNSSDLDLAIKIIDRLANGEILELKYQNHKLSGDYQGCEECHLKPDLLLIYKKEKDLMILSALRIGSHSKLF